MGCASCGGRRSLSTGRAVARRISKTLDRPFYDENGKLITSSYRKHLINDAKIKRAVRIQNLNHSAVQIQGSVISKDT